MSRGVKDEIRFSAITRPDGSVSRVQDYHNPWDWESKIYGDVGRQTDGAKEVQAWVSLDVSTASGWDFLPGKYVVDLAGVTVYVTGPWELHFSISGP